MSVDVKVLLYNNQDQAGMPLALDSPTLADCRSQGFYAFRSAQDGFDNFYISTKALVSAGRPLPLAQRTFDCLCQDHAKADRTLALVWCKSPQSPRTKQQRATSPASADINTNQTWQSLPDASSAAAAQPSSSRVKQEHGAVLCTPSVTIRDAPSAATSSVARETPISRTPTRCPQYGWCKLTNEHQHKPDFYDLLIPCPTWLVNPKDGDFALMNIGQGYTADRLHARVARHFGLDPSSFALTYYESQVKGTKPLQRFYLNTERRNTVAMQPTYQ